MVKVREDLTGQKFGKLTVLKQAEDYIDKNGIHIARWWVKCDCGSNEFIVRGNKLKNGYTKSCGCMQKEAITKIGHANKKYNKYDLSGDYGIGYTSKGEEFWFDLEDYDKIKNYCWHYDDQGYVKSDIYIENKHLRISLHRLIMDFPESKEVDHIIHLPKGQKKFDNRKSNLRIVNESENQMNKHKQGNNTSGIVGVSWHSRDSVWEAYISYNNKQIYLGRFNNKEDAAFARKIAENKYFGEHSFENSGNER